MRPRAYGSFASAATRRRTRSLVSFLAFHCLAGVIAGWTMLGGLLRMDIAGLGVLVMASDLFPVPLLMLLAAFAITFGAVAMGSAIMGLGRSGGPAGMTGRGRLRVAPHIAAPIPLPDPIRADRAQALSRARRNACGAAAATRATCLALVWARMLCCTSHIQPSGGTVIDLYTWSTPNGRKVSIMLEEVGLPYEAHPINIGQDDQFKPEFLKISPNNKIPAIVDRDNGYSMFELGAILIYLADKAGKLLPPQEDYLERMDVMQWLMFQMGNVGPFFGQTHHFNRFAKEKIPYAIERYVTETKRLYGVMDRRLAKVAYLAGDDYSIADVATFPWVARWSWHGLDGGLRDYPNVVRWFDAIRARPAVQRGYNVPASDQEIPAP